MARVLCAPILVGLAALLMAPASPSRALEPGRKPSAAHRLVRLFDFEEQGVNPDPVPMRWVRGQDSPERSRPGFPVWNRARFDDTTAHSGAVSVLLPARGGNTALALVPGVVPVVPGGVYEVSAFVKTAGLTHAAARLSATLHAGSLDAIPGSKRTTDLIGTSTTDGWRRVAVRLTAGEGSAWLTIELELLQPSQQPAGGAGRTPDERLDDLDARVWFDDVTVRLIPVISLRLGNPTGVILGADSPTITTTIDDVAGDPLSATIRIIDAAGATLASHTIDPVQPGVGATWRPRLPGYGWYQTRITVRAEGTPIATQTRAFVWAPTAEGPINAAAFGVALRSARSPRSTLVSLIDAAAVGAVDIPLWSGVRTRDDLAGAMRDLTALTETLLSRGLDVGLTLTTLPAGLARDARLEPTQVIEALADPAGATQPWLDEALSRFGQRIDRWRLGPRGRPASHDPGRDAALFSAAAAPLRDRILNPTISLSAPMPLRPPAGVDPATLALVWPASMRPRAIVDLIGAEPEYARATVLLEPDHTVGAEARAIDLAQRALRAAQAGVRRTTLIEPWTWSGDDTRGPIAEPDITLAVWRTLAQRLSGRRVVGELPLDDGAVALVLDGPAGGAIVAWNEWAEPEAARLTAFLADGPVRAVDLFGNESAVPLRDGVHTVELDAEPIILEGVDAALARFRAGFRVTPARVESTAERHALNLLITNPWPVAINGAIRVTEPRGWSFSPREQRFSLGPGESATLPVSASFGLAAEAGPKRLRAEVRLVAARRYPVLTLETPIDLGLTGVEMIPSYDVRRTGDRADLVVTLLVINTGDEPATLTAYAQARGLKREHAPISDLQPSAAAVRRFVFRGAADDLAGSHVQVGVIESIGLGRLTQRLRID